VKQRESISMASIIPSLTDSYPVATLPRIPDLGLSEKVVISSVKSPQSSIIDVGISKSIISSYIIKPTPKLLWSFALNPTTIVNCMDVVELEDAEQSESGAVNKIYFVGITDRKKHKLLVIKKLSSTSHESYDLKVDKRIVAIKSFQNGTKIVVVYDNGSVQLIENNGESLELSENLLKYTNTNTVYSEFLNFNDSELLLQVGYLKSKLIYSLVSLDFANFFEVKSVSTSHKNYKSLVFSYNSGYLYQLDPVSKAIDSLSIVSFQVEKSISVAPLLTEANYIGMISPSLDRILLSCSNKLYLINFKFASLLSTFESKSSSSSPGTDSILLQQAVQVKGNSIKSSKTIAIYLNLKPKDNNVNVNIINVDVGTNKLSECLGKSIEQAETSFRGVVNLIEEDFDTASEQFGEELQQVYESLKAASESEDLQKWERILVPYMKNEPWPSIKKSINKRTKSSPKNNGKTYNFKEFDVDTDRIIDINFIKQVLLLVFKIVDNEVQFINENFVPEFTLIYFLTNPIFPFELTFGLLKLFNTTQQTTLLRQCIITCPFLNVTELLIQLVDPSNSDEIFEDIINRLCLEFSSGEITKQFKQLIISRSITINLDDLLVRLFKICKNNNSLLFLEILIDVGGLFNWSMNTVDTLNEFIENKISALMDNSYNLTLTNQALLLCEPKKMKKSKKKSINTDITSQQSQLNSILSMKNNTSSKDLNSTIEISKKVPTYSIEKLTI